MTELSEQSGGAANYRRGIRAAARGLWLGAFDYYQAYDSLDSTIRRRIPQAWHSGAKECGVKPDELSPGEQLALQQAITSEISHIDALLAWVEQNSKAAGGKLGVVGGTGGIMSRVDLWVNRYDDIKQRGMVMACADMKTHWTLGDAEHCPSCLKLSGKVKRNSYWFKMGVQPKHPPNPKLECGGHRCQCELVPTDEPMSKGPLPSLP